jgi:integrase
VKKGSSTAGRVAISAPTWSRKLGGSPRRRIGEVSPSGCSAGWRSAEKGRPVSLLPEAGAALAAHRARYLEDLVKYRPLWEAAWAKSPEYRDLVFPSKAGTPIDHAKINRQRLKPLLRKAELPPMRPYDIRHSFATLWVESAEVLQKVLGHSSIAITINTYSHLSPRYQRGSFGSFGDALGGR